MSPFYNGGDERVRTAGLLLARQALSQLSYTPTFPFRCLLWSSFPTLSTSQGAYTLKTVQYLMNERFVTRDLPFGPAKRPSGSWASRPLRFLHLRKEVIQPHLPIRLPCYDFTPVIDLTFDDVLLSVRLSASGALNSHGVTGGVYKARERIHRGMLIRDY